MTLSRIVLCAFFLTTSACARHKPTGATPTQPSIPKQPAHVGPIIVELAEARVEGGLLVVGVFLKNDENNTTVDFRSWQHSNASARDDVGNGYPSRPVPASIERDLKALLAKEGGKFELGSGPLVRHKPRLDVVAFERPAPIASSVVVTLGAENLGGSGKPVQFYMTRDQWTH